MDLLSFILVIIPIIVSPGPDTIFIMNQSVQRSSSYGIMASLGVCLGLILLFVLAGFGLSALLVKSALAFTLIKYVGVAYFCFGYRSMVFNCLFT